MWSVFFLLRLLFVFFCSSRRTFAIVNSGGPYFDPLMVSPQFISKPNVFRVIKGETVDLPCEVQNLGGLVIVWKRRGTALLTAGEQKITTDPRISLSPASVAGGAGFNLLVRDIRDEDQGDYTCQIGDGSHGDLTHSVQILTSPRIQLVPDNQDATTTRKGGMVSFECRASGNPTPLVQWSKKDGVLPSGLQVHTGYQLTLHNVQRQDAGIYQCSASNEIGQPASADVRLHVLYPPEVKATKSWVNSGEGLDAKLECLVHADPPAEVLWYQNSFLLQPTDRRLMSSSFAAGPNGEIAHTLTIRHVRFPDFGNYSCAVSNSIGKAKRYVELSGKPGPAHVVSPKYSFPTYYDLEWSVQSVLPITEVKILYRRLSLGNATSFYGNNNKGQWHDIVVRPRQKHFDPMTGERVQVYRLVNLVPDSVYECLVLTQNQHGYSDVSDVYQWFTSQKGKRPFVTSDASMYTCIVSATIAMIPLYALFS